MTFGDVSVGSSATQSLTITNSGTGAVNVSGSTISGTDLTFVGGSSSIAAGQTSTVQIQFAPQLPGDVTGMFSLSSNASNSPLSVSVKGSGRGPRLMLSPTPLIFGNVTVGQTDAQSVQLTNSGNADLIVNLATVSGNGFGFTGLSLPTTISAGASLPFTAQFAPAATGGAIGSISITDNSRGSPHTLALSGSGVAANSTLNANPGSLNFGNVLVGSNTSQTITLANSGNAGVAISQAVVSGAGFSISGLPVPSTINAGQNVSFSAKFSPASSGTSAGSVSITSNAPGSPLTISLGGTGTLAQPQLTISPANISFGSVNVGSAATQSVSLTNSGNAALSISQAVASGTGFSLSGLNVPQTIIVGASISFTAEFAPASTGSASGGISITSNATNAPATVALSGVGLQSAPPTFPVWVSPSLVRVGKADVPGTASSISLSSARGETVDTQVIVQGSSGGLTNVNVSASALSGPGGASLPASSFTLYREYYLTVTGTASYGGGSNPPLGSGTYPEPLIPFNDPETGLPLCGTGATLKACNAGIPAGQNQPYWIDLSVPHGATNSPPGTYTGSISITADQGNATIPITLTVWNFELPAQPSELSLWTLWPPAAGNTTATLAQALMRNKVMGWYDVAANASSDTTNFGLNRSGLDNSYFIGIQCNGSYSSIPSTSQINTAAANYPAGLGLDFYLADELNGCTSDYTAIKTMGTNAHAANRSVKTMMTINATDANLYGAIDHWVLLDSVQQWPAVPFSGGGDLWSYTSCNAGFGNTPEWMVDYPPINERMQAGFLNWAEGATGVLYYRSDGWTAGNAIGSWNNVDTTACGGGLGRPGDGIFLYPPGPIASSESAPGIRLKAIRDGIQDYEYAQILKNLGQIPFVNSTLLPIATNWSNWSHDPNALESARLLLGQLLHQLSPP
jgi:hypothetical protein